MSDREYPRHIRISLGRERRKLPSTREHGAKLNHERHGEYKDPRSGEDRRVAPYRAYIGIEGLEPYQGQRAVALLRALIHDLRKDQAL